MIVIVRDGQSLFDIALQATGSIEAVYELAKLNGIPLDVLPPVGLHLKVPETINPELVQEFNRSSLYINNSNGFEKGEGGNAEVETPAK